VTAIAISSRDSANVHVDNVDILVTA